MFIGTPCMYLQAFMDLHVDMYLQAVMYLHVDMYLYVVMHLYVLCTCIFGATPMCKPVRAPIKQLTEHTSLYKGTDLSISTLITRNL